MKPTVTIIFMSVIVLLVEGGGKFLSFKDSSENFAADIFKNLPNNEENKLISPISIQTALALLQTGTSKQSLAELANVLYFPKNKNKLIDLFHNYLENLNNVSEVNLNLANTIFVRNNLQLSKQYKKSSKLFGTEIYEADFTNPKVVTKKINDWVQNHTNNKIKNIIDEDNIQANTALLLINAIYFNANWENPFDSQMTTSRTFYANGKNKTKVDMMILATELNYTENEKLKVKILELPYKGEDIVMTIVLPKNTEDVVYLKNDLDKLFDENSFEMEEVTVMLPKFKMEQKVNFNENLKTLGIKTIFHNLDFKGVPYNKDLKVSQVLQKTFIDVNEVGTEAAGVTVVELEDRMGNIDKKFFIADHPFLFFIRQKSTGAVYFVGEFTKP